MSGGVAYVYEPDREAFVKRCNLGTVELERIESEADVADLRRMLNLHARTTGSAVAAGILEDWDNQLPNFIKVMPTDYKRVLAERMDHDEELEAPAHLEGHIHTAMRVLETTY